MSADVTTCPACGGTGIACNGEVRPAAPATLDVWRVLSQKSEADRTIGRLVGENVALIRALHDVLAIAEMAHLRTPDANDWETVAYVRHLLGQLAPAEVLPRGEGVEDAVGGLASTPSPRDTASGMEVLNRTENRLQVRGH